MKHRISIPNTHLPELRARLIVAFMRGKAGDYSWQDFIFSVIWGIRLYNFCAQRESKTWWNGLYFALRLARISANHNIGDYLRFRLDRQVRDADRVVIECENGEFDIVLNVHSMIGGTDQVNSLRYLLLNSNALVGIKARPCVKAMVSLIGYFESNVFNQLNIGGEAGDFTQLAIFWRYLNYLYSNYSHGCRLPVLYGNKQKVEVESHNIVWCIADMANDDAERETDYFKFNFWWKQLLNELSLSLL